MFRKQTDPTSTSRGKFHAQIDTNLESIEINWLSLSYPARLIYRSNSCSSNLSATVITEDRYGATTKCPHVASGRSSLVSFPRQPTAKLPNRINYSIPRINTAPAHPAHASSINGKMTSIGTGYDLLNSIFSPDGRNFQVEYAVKAVENGGTSIGIRCDEGVVLAVEKVVASKLAKAGANKRIGTVDNHIGIVYSGMTPDGRHFIDRARDESHSWRQNFKAPIPTADLASRMGSYLQAYTMYGSVRPFGITGIIGGVDTSEDTPVAGEVGSGPACGAGGKVAGKKHGGPFLYMVEPSGQYWGYYGAATGKGRQTAKGELEKLDLQSGGSMTLLQAVKEAARIIYVAQKDNKDKDFELEMTWISTADGPTKGRHVEVPKELREEAERLAKAEDESDDEEEESEKKDDDKMEE